MLKEVKHSWSTEEAAQSELTGTAIDVGTSIRNAMVNWKDGIGPLMSALGFLDQSGNVPTLGVDVQSGWISTSWYRGDEIRASVVQLPRDLHDPSKEHFRDWPSWSGRTVEPTRVWPWRITHDGLSGRLREKLRSFQLALDSTEGFHEFAYDFTDHLCRGYLRIRDSPTLTDVIDHIDKLLLELNGDPRGCVMFAGSGYSLTTLELQSFRERVLDLSHNGINVLEDPWPGPDKERLLGRGGWMWFERYTEERLLQRTNAVFNGALRIYNDIVERWLPAFNQRNQMRHALPFRMRGEIRLLEGSGLGGRDNVSLNYWIEWAHNATDSGVFIEIGPKDRAVGEATQERVRVAQDEFVKRGLPYHYGWCILPGHEPRPATKLAHEWLKGDLRTLNWTGI